MNEAAKAYLKKLDKQLIDKLTALGWKVYQDNVTQDELTNDLNGVYQYIIFETGGMQRAQDKEFSLYQDILVRLYAEGVDDLDGVQIDVISSLEGSTYRFINSTKGSIQKGQEESYIDGIEFNFRRSIKLVC